MISFSVCCRFDGLALPQFGQASAVSETGCWQSTQEVSSVIGMSCAGDEFRAGLAI